MVDVGRVTGVQFQAESVSAAWDEALPLLHANNAETGLVAPVNFAPAKDKLIRMEEAGFVRVFTMRHEGGLTGYQVFFVLFSLDFPDNLISTCRAAYIVPEQRKTFSAGKFLLWADGQLINEGVYSIARQSTAKLPLGDLYQRMGYFKSEENWLWERGGNV